MPARNEFQTSHSYLGKWWEVRSSFFFFFVWVCVGGGGVPLLMRLYRYRCGCSSANLCVCASFVTWSSKLSLSFFRCPEV